MNSPGGREVGSPGGPLLIYNAAMPRHPWLVLGGLFTVLCVVTALWLAIDTRPPEWDHANHLERAVDCYRILTERGHDRLREILLASSFYPPVVPCAAGLLYFVFPVTPMTSQAVMLAFLALGLASVFALGRHLLDTEAGLLAAFLLGTAPFVVFSLMNFQLDLPLMAVVPAALYALASTEGLTNARWTGAFGLLMGLGMVIKPPFAAYVLPALAWTLWRALRSPGRRRALGLLAVSLAIAACIALPWYGPRALGIPMQIMNRSFKQAAEAGQSDLLTAGSLLFYLGALPTQFGLLAGALFLWGCWVIRRERGARALLWLAAPLPFVMFSLIQNKNFRYTLPILPAAALVAAAAVRNLRPAWRRGATWACVVVGVLQVSMAAFGIPKPPLVPPFWLPLALSNPPVRADWQQSRILADLVRETGGRPATVAVVPNYNFFSVSNFRYDAVRRGLPYRMTRAWSGAPLGVDFVILKTGSQGPVWSAPKLERLTAAMSGGDPYLATQYPVVAEYPLPDGTRASLRARRIAPLRGVPARAVARRLESDPARFLAAYVAEASGLRLRVDGRPEALLEGRAERLELTADTALMGEISRRDRAPLRVRDLRLEIEGLVFDPARLMRTGDLVILDIGALRIRHLTLTEEDLRQFLAGQPAGAGVALVFGDGAARARITRLGPVITAAVRLAQASDGRPFRLAVENLRVAGMPVPGFLVDWIVRHLDPTLALAHLPIAVSLPPVRILPGRIEIGEK